MPDIGFYRIDLILFPDNIEIGNCVVFKETVVHASQCENLAETWTVELCNHYVALSLYIEKIRSKN